ncbi:MULTISPECIES: PadR family transcriptional regulator [Herpetosiphon]|uniref:PadR family transcriptional regulator n=1 Tax=Herpetosiphon TaxID=64 RepID=UPI000D7C9A17|nr:MULTISPECIES: PadR family transcriptional regulator [Herpetosiphon]MBM7843647.1 PadR family transcriptional regulator PadR [Herpetosiphon giganteus]
MFERELLKGSLGLMLMALIEQGPMYGYLIAKEIRSLTDDVIDLKEGSLYPALHRLEKEGMIEGFWQRREDGVDRRYYRITAAGQAVLDERRAQWSRFSAAVSKVVSDAPSQ